jgi:GAF domain-containing protein
MTDLDAGERLARLTRLLEVSRMLTSELDLSEIVHQVLVRAIEVIPAADAGTLYLVDPTSGKLVVTDSVGFGPSIFAITLEPGEAAAGRAYHSGQGAIYPDRQAVQDVLADASPETYRNFEAATQGLRAPQAAMSAPLVFKGNVLGALVVDALQGHRKFGPGDLQMLEDFAQIAAIAIANARLYDSEHTSRLRLEILIAEITRQRDELDRRLRALDSMSQIAREGLSLQALAGRLASLASGRVLILDGLHRQRAAEPQDDVQRLLACPELKELLRRVERDRTRHSAMVDGVHLVVAPVVAGAEPLGYIVLESISSDSSGLQEGLADSAALIASTAFVQERALEEGNVRRRADLLQRLLEGEVPKSAASFRALPPPLQLAVGRLRRRDQGREGFSDEHNVLREVRATTEQMLRSLQTASVVALREHHVVAAWSCPGDQHLLDPTEKLEAVVRHVRDVTGWHVCFAITEPVADPQVLTHAYHEARLAAEIRYRPDESIIRVGHLGA